MIILGKRLYKDHLNYKESNQHNFTKVQVPLEQEYNLYNIKNLPFIKKRRKKKKTNKVKCFFCSLILPMLH